MTASRRTSLVAGTLFVVATLAALAGAALTPDLTGPERLASAAAGSLGAARGGALLTLLAAVTGAGIAVVLFPVLTRTHPALAAGALIARAVEAVFYGVSVVALLGLLSLAGATDAPSVRLGDALAGVRMHASAIGVVAVALGTMLYSTAFYRARLVPRWLAAWGGAAAALLLISAARAILLDVPVTSCVVLAAPIFVQELVLAGWLLVRGFSPASTDVVRSEGMVAETAGV